MQINEEELKYVLSELLLEEDMDWFMLEFKKILAQYRASILTTYNENSI